MANEQNLRKIKKGELSSEELKKRQRNGGLKSVEVRAERKKMRELLEIALMMTDEETGEKNNTAITAALINKAKSGDTKAYEVIRDTIGEKPVDKVQNDLTLKQALVVWDEVESEKVH